MQPFALLAVALAVSACASTAKPLRAGRGLVSADRSAPAGVETFAAPAWQVGDRFVFQKAGRARIAVRVERADEQRVELVDEETQRRTLLTAELAELGELDADGKTALLALDPADSALSWPLWVGKRWSCEFTSRAAGREDLPLLAHYVCDAEERVTVPAGTFRCLRIWRRVRPAGPGNYGERAALAWYAPELGAFVRKLADGLETVLVEHQRQ